MPQTTITFKTLNQKTFKIVIDDEEKVSQLKKKIHEEKGDEFPVDQQRLIHTGKILADETIIKDCGIDPVKTFVVIMAIKPKPVPGAPAQGPSTAQPVVTMASATATVSSVASSTAVSAPSATSASGEATSTASTATDSSTTTQSSVSETSTVSGSQITTAESQLVTGSQQETAITELMNIGYSREQVTRAMQRSFNNPDRAAEILLSGADGADDVLGGILSLGEDTQGDDMALDQVLDDSSTPAAVLPGQGAPPAQGTGNLAFLRHLPQFEMMRRSIQANPGALPGLLQELGRSNQQLLALISNNQQEFIAMLNEPIDEGGADGAGDADGGGDADGAGGGANVPQVQVTQEEKAKIDNMVSMGFSEHEVVQAFFACDKDESLAVNFLLSGGMMDD